MSQPPDQLLIEEEFAKLSPEDQRIVRALMNLRSKEAECEASGGHERVATKDTRWGWHEGHCAKCGKNLDYDSGD